MRAKTWVILTQAVEQGVAYGHQRAYKHTATPPPDEVRAAIEEAVMNAICEVFSFEAPEGPE